MSLSPQALKQIGTWNQSQTSSVSIQLILPDNETDSEEEQSIINQFTTLAEQFNDAADHLEIKSVRDLTQRPGFKLTENIFFSAFPAEKELAPFLKALSLIPPPDKLDKFHKSSLPISEQLRLKIDQIDIPVRLKLYIALFCPHCPFMVEKLIPIALYSSHIHLDIVDGSLFEKEAQKEKILSAPCLILDDNFRWTGDTALDEIVNMIIDRDTQNLSMETLKTILEQGDAQWIADQMISADRIFDAFIQLLCHPTWSVRLGAMVVIEELAEKAPKLAEKLCPILIKTFESQDIPVQGDLLYAMGETGSENAAQWIEKTMSQFTHPDLKEAAEDALESLRES